MTKIDQIIRDVAELQQSGFVRENPDDPALMLATEEELRRILEKHLADDPEEERKRERKRDKAWWKENG